MRALLEDAKSSWAAWFGHPASKLRLLALDESSSHEGRMLGFVFADDDHRPSAVVKYAVAPDEMRYVTHEQEALVILGERVGADLRSTMPRALALSSVGDGVASWMSAVDGRRVPNPLLRRPRWRMVIALRAYMREALAWSHRLACATAHGSGDHDRTGETVLRFTHHYATSAREQADLRSFGNAIAAATAEPLCWQHGDVSFRNTLRWRGELRMLDWEHAAVDVAPWYDPAVLLRNVLLLTAGRRTAECARATVAGLLHEGHPLGRVVRGELERAWDHDWPIGWAVTMAWMEQALRRRDAGRGGDDVLAALPLAVVSDPAVRHAVPWLVPG